MLKKNIPTDVIRDGLNQHLRPHPISIISAEIVDIDFNSRFSAKLRWYEYKIVNRRSPLTLANNKAWCVYKLSLIHISEPRDKSQSRMPASA